ncbi:MAG: hypothetical protein GVY28_12220 [Alphaproteobacteria bacterium]|jgi:hypothetical protein|nr:hypothetical protein [Alphaproteobacteria bacterium]
MRYHGWIPSINDVDREVLNHSWVHYRHLEDQRQKRIALYYAIIVSTCAFIGIVVRIEGGISSLQLVVALYIVSTSISISGLFTYLTIVKLQAAIAGHARLITDVMKRSYGDQYSDYFYLVFKNAVDESSISYSFLFKKFPKITRSSKIAGLFSVSYLTRVFIFLIVFAISVGSVVAFSIQMSRMPPGYWALTALCVFLNCLSAVFIALTLSQKQRGFPSD